MSALPCLVLKGQAQVKAGMIICVVEQQLAAGHFARLQVVEGFDIVDYFQIIAKHRVADVEETQILIEMEPRAIVGPAGLRGASQRARSGKEKEIKNRRPEGMGRRLEGIKSRFSATQGSLWRGKFLLVERKENPASEKRLSIPPNSFRLFCLEL